MLSRIPDLNFFLPGSRVEKADPDLGPGAFDHGIWDGLKIKDPGSGSGMNIPHHIFEILKQFLRLQLMRMRDPESF
jgi:hypothetical protein